MRNGARFLLRVSQLACTGLALLTAGAAELTSMNQLGEVVTQGPLKGLPSSYNKDLQDDKRVLFDAVDTLLLVLPAVAGALAECTFQPQRMRAALDPGGVFLNGYLRDLFDASGPILSNVTGAMQDKG